MLVLQGSDDRVVPPSQAGSSSRRSASGACRTPTSCTTAKATASARPRTSRSLEAELSFYAQVLGFEPAGSIPTLEIEHLAS